MSDTLDHYLDLPEDPELQLVAFERRARQDLEDAIRLISLSNQSENSMISADPLTDEVCDINHRTMLNEYIVKVLKMPAPVNHST